MGNYSGGIFLLFFFFFFFSPVSSHGTVEPGKHLIFFFTIFHSYYLVIWILVAKLSRNFHDMLIYIDEALLFSNFPDARPKKWRNEMRHNHRPLIIIIMNICLAFNMFHANILEDSAFSCTILSSALMVILICIYPPHFN